MNSPLETDPIRSPIRSPQRISKTDSHERTNARTDVENNYARASSRLPQRAGAYRGMHASSFNTAERQAAGEGRELLAAATPTTEGA